MITQRRQIYAPEGLVLLHDHIGIDGDLISTVSDQLIVDFNIPPHVRADDLHKEV